MPPTARRVGAETSKTRDTILDTVEKIMVSDGYPSVTYRVVAAKAGVTPSLVQYYFPTLDDIFLAAIRRRTEENEQRLLEALQARPEEPLHVMWEFSWAEATSALVTEFMALGNHRAAIGAEIAKVTAQIRQIQLDALAANSTTTGNPDFPLTPGALTVLISGIPKMLNLEKGVGITDAHEDVVASFTTFIDSIEPPKSLRRPKRATRARR
ncbi:TetR/AcrR family transcriptional regulator [Nocardia sp. 348MFTsu5.1]|uniref:TetR/AcrR family transcriptional regulator n=1 Tax=Nocardia sp. 348MFTsu5.1 TaxID=1172185 RepID=UPI00036E65A2|nr:TetR/AcrR family transcriptional regulator [Nocardia sp. 348MFTsu5.1]